MVISAWLRHPGVRLTIALILVSTALLLSGIKSTTAHADGPVCTPGQPATCAGAPRWPMGAVRFCTSEAALPAAVSSAQFRKAVLDAVTSWNATDAEVNVEYTGGCAGAPSPSDRTNSVGFDPGSGGATGTEAARTLVVTGPGASSSPTSPAIVQVEIAIDQVAGTMTPACLTNVIAHELGHALGLGHSTVVGDLMFPVISASNPASCVITPSARESAALRALYGVRTTGRSGIEARPTAARTLASPEARAAGQLVGTPTFGASGLALAVFAGGSVDQLEAAARAASALAAWAQDARGAFRALIVGGPAFVNNDFRSAFPDGFGGPTSMTFSR